MRLNITLIDGLKFHVKSKNKLQMNVEVEGQDVFLLFKNDKIDFVLSESDKSQEFDSFKSVLKMLSPKYPNDTNVVHVSFPKEYEHSKWQFWKTISLDVWRSKLIDKINNLEMSNPYFTTSFVQYLALGGRVKNESKGHSKLIKKITNEK